MAHSRISQNRHQVSWVQQFVFVIITSLIMFSCFECVQMHQLLCDNGTLSMDLVTIQSIPRNSIVRLFYFESYYDLVWEHTDNDTSQLQMSKQFDLYPYNLSKPLPDGILFFNVPFQQSESVVVCHKFQTNDERLIQCNVWNEDISLKQMVLINRTELIVPNNISSKLIGTTSYTVQDLEMANYNNQTNNNSSDGNHSRYIAIAFDKQSNKIYQIKESDGSYELELDYVTNVNFSFESIVTGDDRYFLYHPERYCTVKSLYLVRNQTTNKSLSIECNQDNVVEVNLFNCATMMDEPKISTDKPMVENRKEQQTQQTNFNASNPSLNIDSVSKRTIIISVVVIIVIVVIVLVVLTLLHVANQSSKSTSSVNPNTMNLKFKSPSQAVPPTPSQAGQQSSTSFPPEFVKPRIAEQPHLSADGAIKQSEMKSFTSNSKKSTISQKSNQTQQQQQVQSQQKSATSSSVIQSGVVV